MEQKEYEPRKLFIGGLPQQGISSASLRHHFARYGHVVEALVMLYPNGIGRGFGFVEFQNEAAVLRALDVRERDAHNDFFRCRVDVKRAEKKQEFRSTQTRSTLYRKNADSKKIFVGGLGGQITKDDLSDYFGKFGTIIDAVVMCDKETKKPRGFGFFTFDSEEAAYKVLENSFHHLKGIRVETKNAEPRDQNGRYHGEMARGATGHWSPANSYGGIYSPYNTRFVPYPYLVPCLYACPPTPGINYGYMTNHTDTSNDTGMMAMQAPHAMHLHYGRSYGYEAASKKLESGRKVKGNQQRIDISASGGLKSDLVKPNPMKPESNLLIYNTQNFQQWPDDGKIAQLGPEH